MTAIEIMNMILNLFVGILNLMLANPVLSVMLGALVFYLAFGLFCGMATMSR